MRGRGGGKRESFEGEFRGRVSRESFEGEFRGRVSRESFEGEFRGRVSREGEGGESLLMMLCRGSTSSFYGLSPLFRSL